MNTATHQDHRAAVLAQLNASIDSFFLNGGQVKSLPASEYVPRRAGREPFKEPFICTNTGRS